MLYNLSLCITDLSQLPDEAVQKASNGKFYLNCSLWINEQENDYGAIGTVTVDKKNAEGKYDKTYIGNVRTIKQKEEEKDSKSWKEHLSR